MYAATLGPVGARLNEWMQPPTSKEMDSRRQPSDSADAAEAGAAAEVEDPAAGAAAEVEDPAAEAAASLGLHFCCFGGFGIGMLSMRNRKLTVKLQTCLEPDGN